MVPLNLLFTSIEDLSTRSKNILQHFTSINAALEYYKNHRSFLTIPNCGKKSDYELRSFFEYILLTNSENQDNLKIRENEISNYTTSQLNAPASITDCIEIYNQAKKAMSKRLYNALKRLEDEMGYTLNLENQVKYIDKLFLTPFNFSAIPNIGLKSRSEIEELVTLFNNLRVQKSIANNTSSSKGKLISLVYYRLSKNISREDIVSCVNDNEEILFSELLFTYLKIVLNKKEAFSKVYELYFGNNNNPCNYSELARSASVTRERARQIIKELSINIIPKYCKRLVNILDGIPYDLLALEGKEIIRLEDLFGNDATERSDKSNVKFKYLVCCTLLGGNYIDIKKVLDNSVHSVLKATSSGLFIIKEVIDEEQLKNFLNWIDNEIYNFRLADFDFNLDVLIKRYFDENTSIPINNQLIDTLRHVINSTLISVDNFSSSVISRAKKNKRMEEILSLVTSYLIENNKPQRTSDILIHLNKNYLEIEREELLRILGNKSAVFKRAGLGFWSLKDMDGFSQGTLRSIITTQLESATTPVHISDILKYINEFRPTTAHSIISNLKSDPLKTFIFFNCGFIGLRSKAYDQLWLQLPKTNPVSIRVLYKINSEEELNRKMSELSKLENIPLIHLKYLVNANRRKDI